MIELLRTNSENPDFVKMVKLLDVDLNDRNEDGQGFYNQFNKLDKINWVIVGYLNGQPVACGAIKESGKNAVEVKRMFVKTENRGCGFSFELLENLEKWAKELGYEKCILETGIRQSEAIGLYVKAGYKQIPNYGQYEGIDNSVCFEKILYQ